MTSRVSDGLVLAYSPLPCVHAPLMKLPNTLGLSMAGSINYNIPMARILTTHTGSLPREGGDVRDAVREVVRKQRESGIDIVNDGEQGRRHYATYICDRLTGFGDEVVPYPLPRDQRAF